ncbi:hypothetical protein CTAYLR_007452 [Chrysophaeum taylorii]|uniref:Nuclear pore localisation protein Npl4 ubiquitin-like domain-containing protein n=1 Tax=Chrysophaeum taylorii TaxID=2483200 RepID=A0AAD7UB87_9STRA|nr:hypothetical protein CTAYLR_007452 [Chrysophaeum taylorii]
MLIRVRHEGGTVRVAVDDKASLAELFAAAGEKLGLADVSERLSLDPAGRQPLRGTGNTALDTLGLEHGAMVHLQPEPEPEPEPEEPPAVFDEDPDMAEAIAIARAADEAESRPRAPDNAVRDRLIGGPGIERAFGGPTAIPDLFANLATPIEADLALARDILARDAESDEGLARRVAARDVEAQRAMRAALESGQRRRDDDFPEDEPLEDEDEAADGDAALQRALYMSAQPDQAKEDTALQRALYMSAQPDRSEDEDGDLARALAMSMAEDVSQREAPPPAPMEDDADDLALQSALLDVDASARAIAKREAAEQAELEEAIRISAMDAKPDQDQGSANRRARRLKTSRRRAAHK